MTKNRRIKHLVVVGVLAVIVAVLAAFGGLLGKMNAVASPVRPDLIRMSNTGIVASPTARIVAVLARTGTDRGQIRLLGERDGKSFYRIVGSQRGSCYGIGLGSGLSADLNLVSCADFPSSRTPVHDVSIFGHDKGTGVTRWDQVQGWAADGVATISVVDDSGNLVSQTDVKANLYEIGSDALQSGIATRMIGRDQSGTVIFEKAVPIAFPR